MHPGQPPRLKHTAIGRQFPRHVQPTQGRDGILVDDLNPACEQILWLDLDRLHDLFVLPY